MFTPRTATGLTIALLALPATAAAAPVVDHSGGGGSGGSIPPPDWTAYGWGAVPFNPAAPSHMPTASRAGPASHALRSPDAADAARAGDIAKAMEHYERSQPLPAAARPASPPEAALRP